MNIEFIFTKCDRPQKNLIQNSVLPFSNNKAIKFINICRLNIIIIDTKKAQYLISPQDISKSQSGPPMDQVFRISHDT